MPELLVKTVRELPNGNILFEKRLYFLTERDIIELRKKTNWVKGKKGLFAGSLPMGGKMSGSERRRVSSAIATNFPNLKADGVLRTFRHGNYSYKFDVVEFGTYNFYKKSKLK